jgi:hypothetical protein
VVEQNHGFRANLIQKAMEGYSLVEDSLAEEGSKQRHWSLKTYDIESSPEREMPPTHHNESNVIYEAYQGDVPKLFNMAYKRNVFKTLNMRSCILPRLLMSMQAMQCLSLRGRSP